MYKYFAAFISFFVLASASDVLEFTDANFQEKVAEHDVILVEFFAPWCGHCKRLAPEYEKAATNLKDNDPPVALAKVDCTVEKATCDKFGVSGFPTLKIFRNGEMSSDYSGPREADGIVKYMRGQAGPVSKEINSVAELEKFINNDDYSIVGFFKKQSKLEDAFMKIAASERENYRFAHTSDKSVLEQYNHDDDIVVFQPKRLNSKFEEKETVYDGTPQLESIKKFIKAQTTGLCGHRTSDNAQSFQKPLIVVYYNVDYVKDLKGTNYWRNRVLKVAQDYKDKLTFAVSNKNDFSHELDEHGLAEKKSSEKPVVAGMGKDGEKYPMTEEFSLENLKKFADDVLSGKLEAYMKSEAIPDNNDGPVTVVVAKNFKEVVEQDKDILIEFYAPWCGHCKKLAPIFDELGEKMKNENVVIAKMDATANDVPPSFGVTGFPTLFWIPKGKKSSPVRYNGGRELNDFITYIAKESTNELNGWSRDGKEKKLKKKKDNAEL
jgi:protein disulfide isomerase family A protein 3